MTVKRKVIVNILATIAFIFLFLLPVLAFMATTAQAGATSESAAYTGDYIFFVVNDNTDVPLAAAPTTTNAAYILWVGLASFAIMIGFIYSAWYLSVRRNLREMSYKLSPLERRAFKISQGYLHPIRSYRLAKEAEDSVASMYVNYI